MIVILCESFDDVIGGFSYFMNFLETYEWEQVLHVYDCSYSVETIDGLRYVFLDYRMRHLFNNETTDFIDMYDFFEGMYEYYEGGVKYGN